jgi:nicotinate phosphoribosyltransferase
MLTDTYTAQAFFVDFIANISRALRWTTLRQDSGDPFAFVKDARKNWIEVGKMAGIDGEDEVLKGRRVIFSDGLDTQKAIDLQKGCDDIGVGGDWMQLPSGRLICAESSGSFLWNRDLPHQRFQKSLRPKPSLQAPEHRDQA